MRSQIDIFHFLLSESKHIYSTRWYQFPETNYFNPPFIFKGIRHPFKFFQSNSEFFRSMFITHAFGSTIKSYHLWFPQREKLSIEKQKSDCFQELYLHGTGNNICVNQPILYYGSSIMLTTIHTKMDSYFNVKSPQGQ